MNLAFFTKHAGDSLLPIIVEKLQNSHRVQTYQLKNVQILVAPPPPGLSLKEKALQGEKDSYRGIFSMMLLLYNC